MRPVNPALQDTLVHSFLFLRRAIGFLGVALPVVLIIGTLVVDRSLLGSISGAYYTSLRDVFVGSMCAIGVFLLSYHGYGLLEDIAGDVAAVAAIGLALCPTLSPGSRDTTDRVLGTLHLVFAAVFFLTMAFFCLVLFRRDDAATGRRRAQRKGVYLASGLVIVVCLALIAVTGLAGFASWHVTLWLESAAILAYGVAWLTKGDALLRDISPADDVVEAAASPA